MADFIDLWPCLFTIKLSQVQLFKWGHSIKLSQVQLFKWGHSNLHTPDTKQFSVDKQCSLITSVSNFCYHHQNLLQFTKIPTRIHVFWPCLKLHNWCFWSNSTLLSFCAPYRCKHKCLWGICIYSDMEHIHGRQARRSFCSRYRCKYNSPNFSGSSVSRPKQRLDMDL